MTWAAAARGAKLFLLGTMACCASGQGSTIVPVRTSATTLSEHCQMALAALGVTIKTYQEQPLGLNKRCVEGSALLDGRIYVDARFTRGDRLETFSASCAPEHYSIRFDPNHFVPSPTEQVVVLVVEWNADGSWDFNAVMEVPNWPQRRPETMTLSQCGSAFGVLRRSATGWTAEIVTPPRSPDAL